jgi:uncharacterized membrane protein YhhN
VGRFILESEALELPIWWAYAAAVVLITAGLFFGRNGDSRAVRPAPSAG